MSKTLENWDRAYSTNHETDVSWFQPVPQRSLALISAVVPNLTASVIDVGGGASRLVDELLALGHSDVTVLDVSQAALDRARARLGRLANKVPWIVADITQWAPTRSWDIWHDRAVFHFLVEAKDQDAYVAALGAVTRPGSTATISTFALHGPERCSGLPVQRYGPEALAARIGSRFELVSQDLEAHATPSGHIQNFAYTVLKRR
jgi:SAM-dependent methyltransferase